MAYEPSNIVQAELAALQGKRAPPTHLAVMGASSFRSEFLKPSSDSHYGRKSYFQTEANPPIIGGRGTSAWLERAPATGNIDSTVVENETREVLRGMENAEAALDQALPVHHYDLHETAMRRQQEIIDRENMVCCPSA